MALKNIIITGSIGTYPTLSYGQKMYVSSTDEESFPIEEVIGSNGGSMPNLFGQTSSLDLYVNIDQKWSGYNDTQVGLVAYTQSFQSEFINGELSGSVLTVSNGNLNDPYCQEILKVSTVNINYDIFIYNSLYHVNNSAPGLKDENFINSVVAPNNGEIFILNSAVGTAKPNPITGYYDTSNLLTYIKISRFDKQGNDNTLSLQELTKLTVKFTDIGIIDLPLFTISEYPTYYLYTTYYSTGMGYVLPPTVLYPFNTVDNNIRTHQFKASAGVYYIPPYSTYNGNTLFASIDNNSCFNPITGLYTFNDTPNIEIYYTASFKAVNSFIGSMIIYGDTSSLTPPISFISGLDYTITGSLFPIENQQYTFKINNAGGTGANITNISFELTQSVSFNSSSNLTVLEPYLTQNFEYNDCNALYGNALNLEYDSNFYQVNYEGTTVPTNQQQIISGTAELSSVKSYNYTAASQVLPRYKGSRLTSDAYNTSLVATASLIQSSYPQYLNAKSYGYIPINTYDTVIFEFNGGNPTVEVSKTSRVDISNILNIDNTASVSTIYSSDSAFSEIIEEKLQLKTTPIITQYTTNEIIVPADIKVVTNDISPTPVFMNTSYPQDWTYISGSQQDNSNQFLVTGSYYKINNYVPGDDFEKIAWVTEGTINTDGCIFLIPLWYSQSHVNTNYSWSFGSNLSKIVGETYGFAIGNNPNQVNLFERSWYVYKDPNGDYSPKGSVTTQVISQSITDGINKGERWFITLFNDPFKAPINTSNINLLMNTFTGSSDDVNYPLAYSSAYEISTLSTSSNILIFQFNPPVDAYAPIGNLFQGPPGSIYGGSNNRFGLLIWKSPAITNTILFNGTNLVNLGLGNIITNDSSPTIKNNLNLISKTFGSKP
jgi:hypothetical protein